MKARFYFIGIVLGAIGIGQLNLNDSLMAIGFFVASGYAFYLTTQFDQDGDI